MRDAEGHKKAFRSHVQLLGCGSCILVIQISDKGHRGSIGEQIELAPPFSSRKRLSQVVDFEQWPPAVRRDSRVS